MRCYYDSVFLTGKKKNYFLFINTNKTKRVKVSSGSVNFGQVPLNPKPQKWPRKLAQSVAGFKVAFEKVGPGLAVHVVLRTGNVLIDHSIPNYLKAFSREGVEGVKKEFINEWIANDKKKPVHSALQHTATHTAIQLLERDQLRKLSKTIKQQHGERGLEEIRKIFPEIPANPLDFLGYLSFFYAFLDLLVLVYIVWCFLQGYLEGVRDFDIAYENSTQNSNLNWYEFLVYYFFGDWITFLNKVPIPLGFKLDKQEWLLNCCYISDDIFLLDVNVDFEKFQ